MTCEFQTFPEPPPPANLRRFPYTARTNRPSRRRGGRVLSDRTLPQDEAPRLRLEVDVRSAGRAPAPDCAASPLGLQHVILLRANGLVVTVDGHGGGPGVALVAEVALRPHNALLHVPEEIGVGDQRARY
jgi:hypothetical protein